MDLRQDDVNKENNFNHGLSTETLPEMELSINKFPVRLSKSIVDYSILELEAIDIEVLRYNFMEEIKALEGLKEEERNFKLLKIFNTLSYILPQSSDCDFESQELRLYFDLISTPGLYKIDYVMKFLKDNTLDHKKSNKLLLAIFEYYSNHSDETIEKFNYILRGSQEVYSHIVKDFDEFIYTTVLNKYFSENLLNAFTKEELSQLYKFYFCRLDTRGIFNQLADEKVLFLVSQMNKKVRTLIGHNAEYLENVLQLLKFDNFYFLLNDVYDKVVGGKENEEAFALTYSECDDIVIMRELFNYISSYHHFTKRSEFYDEVKEVSNMDEFLSILDKQRNLNNCFIFKFGTINKIKDGTFDPENDFRKIDTPNSLNNFRDAILYNLYGISLEEAKYFKEYYGKYLHELEKVVIEEDLPILEVLNSIINIVDLFKPNFNEKLDVVRMACLKKFQENGVDYQSKYASSIILEGLFNRMYMNTYNKVLTQVSDKNKIIRYEDGVALLDAGVEFKFMLTSLGAVGEFYEEDVNMASKWNTASYSYSQGLCASFIDNENLGVITLESPILGFNDLPKDSLNIMGTSDLFTLISTYNLRKVNSSSRGRNRYFIPANIMCDQTRYAYNELLLDRFLLNDDDNSLKVQPSYVIYYKMGENDYENRIYKRSLKIAKDFGIPIMVIDVKKVKEHEKKVILELENELFSSSEVKPELLKEIVTRYMNNYTGSLTMVGESADRIWNYEEDFSVEGMKHFFNELENFIIGIEDSKLKAEWIFETEKVYLEEQYKYDSAIRVQSYHSSVRKFILDDFELKDRFNKLKNIMEDEKITREFYDKKEEIVQFEKNPHGYPKVKLQDDSYGIFYSDESFTPITRSIVNLVNSLELASSFKMVDYNYDNVDGKVLVSEVYRNREVTLVENLACSYFFGDCDILPVTSLIFNNYNLYSKEVILTDNNDFNDKFVDSKYASLVVPFYQPYINYNPGIVKKFVSKIENMDEKRFLEIFNPIIDNQSKKTGQSYEEIALILLYKKANVRNVFEKVNQQVELLKKGIDLNTHSNSDVSDSKKSV